MLEGTVQALQDTPATDLGDAAADPLADVLTDLLEVAGGKVRAAVTLHEARRRQPQRR